MFHYPTPLYRVTRPSRPSPIVTLPAPPIPQIASETEDLSTVYAAVGAADPQVAEKLNDPEATLTVFAPLNSAFAALPDGVLATLLMPENQETLTNLLGKHVLSTVVPASAALTLVDEEVMTLADQNIVVNGNGPSGPVTVLPVIVDPDVAAKVVAADIQACNGVIHIVDKVLEYVENMYLGGR